MDYNVSPFRTEGIKRFTSIEKIVLILFLIVPFACFVANFSAYYVQNLNVYSSIIAIISLFFWGHSLLDNRYMVYAFRYMLIVGFAWMSSLLFHLEIPSIKLMYELLFAGCFIAISDEGKVWIYDRFIKLLAILLIFGLVEYIFAMFGKAIIIGEAIRPNSTNTMTYYWGIFNIFPYYFSMSSFRFQSIAEEPGLVGTLCFFIVLTINVKKYKLQSIIFWIAGIMTMSMAFYLLVALWCILSISKKKIKYIILGLFLVGVTYYFARDFIDELVVSRFIEGTADGTLDNRNTDALLKLYNNTFESFDKFICGIGKQTFESMDTGNSAGIKKIIVQYGFVMTMIAVLAFCLLFIKYYKGNRNIYAILFFFILSLYQRFDLNLSTNTIVLFSALLPYFRTNKK